MNEERFLNVEKDVAIIKATQEPLLDKIEKNTEANIRSEKAIIGLTHSIESLVKVQTEIIDKYEDHEERLQLLETKDAVAQSGRDIMKWILRSIIALTVTGVGGMVVFVMKQYLTMTGK